MIASRDELVESLKKIISKYGDCVTEAWLFGSMARGDYKKSSDIDIAVDCRDVNRWFELADEIDNIETIRRIDLHNMSYCEFIFDMGEIRNGIKLY